MMIQKLESGRSFEVFDFLPSVENLLQDIQSLDSTSRAKCIDSVNSLLGKFDEARTFLNKLPGVEDSEEHQAKELARVEEIRNRKLQITRRFNIPKRDIKPPQFSAK
eukprot:290124_1